MARWLAISALVLGAMLAATGRPADAATGQAVDLELALAVDVSGSIDEEEAAMQRDGYIAAFRHPMVIQAIRGGILGRIAVAYYEWAGFGHIRVIVPWTLVHDEASAHAFAAALTKLPPRTARRTAITNAIRFAVPFFDDNGFDGTKRVVDISGDGPNNWGGSVTEARDAAVAAGVTINGLPIVNDRASFWGWPTLPNLDLYYRDCVIGGPGAFIVVANSFEDFAVAVRRKLVLEIAGRIPQAPRARVRLAAGHLGPSRVAPPCNVGERRWRNREDY